MCLEIKNKEIYQFFGHSRYRYIQPTFRGYKLYIISGFNLVLKRSRILAYILIPNEAITTYNNMFNKLKNDFGFMTKIFTIYFKRVSAKAVKNNFPDVYLVKCFLYLVKCIWKYLKKFGLTEKDNINETIELSYNIKMLCFVAPENIYSINKKLQQKYNQ